MEIQNLRLAKYFTAGLAFVLLALRGSLWPFTWWDMYDGGDHEPPTQVARLQLRVLDSAGQQHILHPMDLYTLDDDSSPQTPGHQLVRDAIAESPQTQNIARTYLMRQLEFVLQSKIEQVEIWDYSWEVNFEQHPPIDIDQPVHAQFVDSFIAHTN